MKIPIPILIGFLFFFETLNSQNGITVKLNVPKEISSNNPATVDLEINKPEGMTSYAFFKQVVPAGFNVKPKIVNGVDFKFENNELVITWLRLPSTEKVTVVWELSVKEGTLGNYELSGTFDYIIDNSKGSIELEKYPIHAIPFINLSDTDINLNTDLSPKMNRLRDDVICERRIVFNEIKMYYVVEIIIKSQIGGKYSVVEKIPSGYAFKELEHPKAILKSQSDKAMYIIDHLQPNKEYNIKYLLIPHQDFTGKKPSVYGKLSFINVGEIINLSIVDLK
jgi:hypothetical protein